MAGTDGLEIERKYLVRLLADPGAVPGARTLALRQVYLADTGTGSRRVRSTGEGGTTRYHLTAKVPVSPGVRREDEREIGAEEFAALLGEADPARRPVEKTRYAVPHAGRTWEIDVFAGALAGLVTAEVELGSVEELDAELEPPPCIEITRDVTDDHRFANSALALVDAPPEA